MGEFHWDYSCRRNVCLFHKCSRCGIYSAAIKELAQWRYSIEFHNLTCRWFASRYAQPPVVRCTAMHTIYFTERKCSTTRNTLSARSMRGVALVRSGMLFFLSPSPLYRNILSANVSSSTGCRTNDAYPGALSHERLESCHTSVTLEKTNFPMSLIRS